jgi:hypothetical protein
MKRLTVEVVGVVIFDSNRRANSRMVAHSQVIVEAAEIQLAPQKFSLQVAAAEVVPSRVQDSA